MLRFRLPYLPLLLGVGARAIDETTENKETRTTGVGFGKRWVDGQLGGRAGLEMTSPIERVATSKEDK